MKLSIHLVTYNGAKYIPYLFDSLRKQTFRDWELLVIDNASTDGTVAAVEKELAHFTQPHRLIINVTNRGFSGGHNQAVHETQNEYFLILNQDVYLKHDCFERVISFLDVSPEITSAMPRLMRWNFAEVGGGLVKSFTNQIDSLGLAIHRNRRVTERGVGDEWHAHNAVSESIFGVTGAVAFFRRSALREALFADGALFDSSYGSYKEDVDLAFRLQSQGLSSAVCLNAVAYHDRTGVGTRDLSDWAASKNKSAQSSIVLYNSYRNHLATLYKNEYGQNLALDFVWILWYELKKCVWFLLFKPGVLRGLSELWKTRKELQTKRMKIKELRKVSWKDIRKWWV